jgi:hypothetical protein
LVAAPSLQTLCNEARRSTPAVSCSSNVETGC